MREYDLPSTRRKGTTLVVPKGDYTRGALAPEANRRQEFELVLYFPSVAEAMPLRRLATQYDGDKLRSAVPAKAGPASR